MNLIETQIWKPRFEPYCFRPLRRCCPHGHEEQVGRRHHGAPSSSASQCRTSDTMPSQICSSVPAVRYMKRTLCRRWASSSIQAASTRRRSSSMAPSAISSVASCSSVARVGPPGDEALAFAEDASASATLPRPTGLRDRAWGSGPGGRRGGGTGRGGCCGCRGCCCH